MSPNDMIATVRLVDYSGIIHAVTEGGHWNAVTFCGREAEGYVYGDGHVRDVTCRTCRRAMKAGDTDREEGIG